MTSKSYGASHEQWQQAFAVWGQAVLPSVCSPAAGTEHSPAHSFHKIPSVISAGNIAYPMKGWPQHKTTPADIAKWSADNRLGICVRTADIQAIDIDCDSADVTSLILQDLELTLGAAPMRLGKQGRCTVFVRVQSDEPLRKSVIQMRAGQGAIELLAAGQHTMLAGTHVSGIEYWWPEGIPQPRDIPSISLEDFTWLWKFISETYGTKVIDSLPSQTMRAKGAALSALDPFAQILRESDNFIAEDGNKIHIRCPWSHDHTSVSSVSASSYFGPDASGPANYRCQHSHCLTRNIKHLHEHFGYAPDDFGDVVVRAYGEPAPITAWEDDPEWRKTKPKREGAKAIIDTNVNMNIQVALKYPQLCGNYKLQLDSFIGAPQTMATGDEDWRQLAKTDVTMIQNHIGDTMHSIGFKSSDAIVAAQINTFLKNRTFDSALEALASVPEHDGIARLHRMAPDVLRTKDTPYNRAVGRYIFLSLVLRMSSTKETDVQGTAILHSSQGRGKSSWVKSLALDVNHYKTFEFKEDLKEMRRGVQGSTVLEIGEMAGSEKLSNSTIKAFMTASSDSWRKLYEEGETTRPRRCILIGTTNETEILKDTTGDRRYFPMRICDGLAKGQYINRELFAENKMQYYAEALAEIKANPNCVEELYAELEALPETEAVRRSFRKVSIRHAAIVEYLKMCGQPTVTLNTVLQCIAFKGNVTEQVLRDAALTFVALGSELLDSHNKEYQNIFYQEYESLE